MSQDRIAQLAANAKLVQDRIVRAALGCKRVPTDIQLLWVSKTHPISDVDAAIQAGAVHFGENRVQECVEKFSQIRPGVSLHVIGPVQSNKWRKATSLAQWIHSVDSLEAVHKYEAVCAELGKSLQVLFQVNTSEEASKSGLSMQNARDFLKSLPNCKHLRYRGLMTIGKNTGNAEDSRAGFAWLRELRNEIHSQGGMFSDFTELSMGMTDDLEVAVAEGSTWVRVGTAIFGKRH